MNSLEIHLIINHLPIFASIIGGGLLLYGAFTKAKSIVNFALLLLVAGSILVIPVFLSGEGAEDMIEMTESISEEAIETHENIAKNALWLYSGLGVLSAITFIITYLKNKKTEKFKVQPLVWLVIVYSIGVMSIMIYTGNTGGKIRRPEIRMNNSFNPNIEIKKDSSAY
jgi:uncharacterized membrane protein